MTQYKEIIHDIATGETTERDFTKSEIAAMEEAKAKIELELQDYAAKQILRESAISKLGLTAEEVAAILS
jgi:hypothetical protein